MPLSQSRNSKKNPSFVQNDEFRDTPPSLTEEQKHRLILEHTKSTHAGKDPIQRATAWTGFAVLMLALGWGWWNTVGAHIGSTVGNEPSVLQQMTQNMDAFTNRLQQRAALESPIIPQATSGAEAATFSQLMKQVLEPEATGTSRNDLIAPGVASSADASSTATQAKASSTQTGPAIDPNSPGLKMDE